MKQQFLEQLRSIIDAEQICEMEPMSKHTTFRVGGPADVLVLSQEDQLSRILRLCREWQEPYLMIGNGSNLLVGDKGIRGLVLKLISKDEGISVDDTRLCVDAGILLPKVARVAAEHGLTGMEFAAGIPGSIGGAIVMNSGAYGGEMKDIVSLVHVVDKNGQKKVLSSEDLEFGYRRSCILAKEYIITRVELTLSPGNQDIIFERMGELSKMRKAKQPLEYPSAGSTFKRPEGYFAGKLIMDAGLRGLTVGGAQVSEKHCGFVINTGGASAKDICTLIQKITAEVKRQSGVTLEPEVKLLGEFE
ncbi:MAG: UDP-N-acetylmuramate dehydrogenase [Roseburia sp.]